MRPKTAVAKKRQKGTFKQSRVKKAQGRYLLEVPTAPEFFGDREKEVFDVSIVDLIERQLLTEAGLPLLYAYCLEMGAYYRLQQEIMKEDKTVKGRGQEVKLNPLIRESRERLANAITLGKQFGLTPHSSRLMPLNEIGEAPDDPSDLLL